MAAFDLDAYFQRIGYGGAAVANLATLEALHFCHPVAIPFENLNPFLGVPLRLDPDSIVQKLVHNLLLSHCLTALGFRVTWLAARVMWGRPEGSVGPRSHMLLLIDVGGTPYVADVGFGGLTLTAPLRFQAGIEQPTPHETFQIVSNADGYLLEASVAGEWKALYGFDLQPQTLVDYEVTSWYLSNHPASRFVTNLIAARADRGRRHALFNNTVVTHQLNGPSERRTLVSADDLRAVLTDVFRLALPPTLDVSAAFERVAAVTAQLPL
jgi:N-hydroxyarylamine O-acetyltransferase